MKALRKLVHKVAVIKKETIVNLQDVEKSKTIRSLYIFGKKYKEIERRPATKREFFRCFNLEY